MAVKRYCNLSFLPSEIIESEILPRLPVKSVSRFKSVCKSWNLLISNNPDFIKSHLDLNPNKDSLLVMTSERKKYEETRDESLFQGSTAMIGSVNGLVCFYNWHHEFEGIEFVIWNPATKQCLANIPLLPSRFEEREHDGLIEDCFGFGFDSVANDFKVMYVITIEDQPLVGDIYSCKQRCWKKITPSNFLFRGYVPPLALQVVFRGSPYWLNVQPNGKNSRLTVIWFDVQNEIFRLLPEIGSIDQKQDAVIMNFEDSIAVMVYNRKVLLTEPVDVYVFNERCDVWRKMSIGPVIGKELTIYRYGEHLFQCFKNGDTLFMSFKRELCSVNLQTHAIKSMGKEPKSCHIVCCCAYSESLVSLEGMTDFKEKEDTIGVLFLNKA
ncbi:F-box/kelch-repeat protein At3g23880-like [Apium graveolens]|uniref:F-box/kelch-repeat protein At3g23880-like n=1 Tax=Apium graveolens TaxID=4045 RepID=UPI003D78C8AF